MATQKKRKISGLSSLELALAYQSLTNLKNSLIYEDDMTDSVLVGEAQVAATGERSQEKVDLFNEHLEGMIQLMQSRLEGPQSFTFSGMNEQILEEQMHIKSSGFIKVKRQVEDLIQSTRLLGQDELWSSDNMYRHLTVLEMLVPRATEASARAWIDTFFFRASAMVPVDRRMVLNMEYAVPSTTLRPKSLGTISGRVDYTAMIAQPSAAASLLTTTQISNIRRYMPSGFFVTEGKPAELSQHVPQAVSEMYTCAKILRKSILRGALTNGRQWIFLIIYLKEDGDGAKFKESFPLSFSVLYPSEDEPPEIVKTVKYNPDLIAGILSFWIKHSFDDIAADDWFEDYKV